jgi:transcriptional regulator with XRE-family HTH domain
VIDWYQQAGLTQVELAERSGKSQSFVSALVNGKVPIPDHDMDRFASLTGIPVSELGAKEEGAMWSSDEHAILARLHESPNRRAWIAMLESALKQEKSQKRVERANDQRPRRTRTVQVTK